MRAHSTQEEWAELRATFHLENAKDARAFMDRIYHRTPWFLPLFAHEFPATLGRQAVRELFAALAHWDGVLASQPYLCGTRMTEADIALFTTLLRFDLVYYAHFKCNVRRLRDHANLWRFTRKMFQHPGIGSTCQLEDIKTHYYWSQDNVNPTRIVPLGPTEYAADLDVPVAT